eukprot:scaffold63223_cov63-Phaeocystis_antarctica.AAC.4
MTRAVSGPPPSRCQNTVSSWLGTNRMAHNSRRSPLRRTWCCRRGRASTPGAGVALAKTRDGQRACAHHICPEEAGPSLLTRQLGAAAGPDDAPVTRACQSHLGSCPREAGLCPSLGAPAAAVCRTSSQMRVRKRPRETASDFAALVRDGFLWCGRSLHRVWFVHRALVGGGWWRLGLHRGDCASLPTSEARRHENFTDVRCTCLPQGAHGCRTPKINYSLANEHAAARPVLRGGGPGPDDPVAHVAVRRRAASTDAPRAAAGEPLAGRSHDRCGRRYCRKQGLCGGPARPSRLAEAGRSSGIPEACSDAVRSLRRAQLAKA